MSKSIVILSDSHVGMRECVASLEPHYGTIPLHFDDPEPFETDDALLMVVDVDLSNSKVVERLKTSVLKDYSHLPSVFVTAENRRISEVQSNALGASEIIGRNEVSKRLKLIADAYAKTSEIADPHTASDEAIDRAAAVSMQMFDAVAQSKPLPRKEVIQCGEFISGALRNDGISTWLKMVKQYHSYTHRHSMCVTGFAVAFGLHYDMREIDIQRLATGALMHDIGKARIPIEILDKPHALNEEERTEMRLHPEYGAQILQSDAQFDQEVVNIAHQHHEFLDGSGYPQGLHDDQISDLIRVMTIADIFSALIDRRSYKKSMPRPVAYNLMQRMEGKIDMKFLKAFEDIALQDD